ncbi:MAG: NUDIX domain-containing protein [Deltaproteobacteria bacterium]|nr:NUDIX domain-containing protein [Nannocystaceae bacterium]
MSDSNSEVDGRAAYDDRPATLVDRGFQIAFKVAHRMLRAYWTVRKPHTHGALVAVWYQGEVLLVKNSYRRDYTLPGGYVRAGESVSAAAARELAEECEIAVDPASIRQVYTGVHAYEHREDDVTISEITVERRPRISVDHREVVWAGFKSPEAALAMSIVPHLREYLMARRGS